MRVLLIGGTGGVGRRAAAELTRIEKVTALTVAGRRAEAAGEVVSVLGGGGDRVTGMGLDAADEGDLERAARQHDVVASCAGPAQELEVAAVQACIEARTPYVSLCDDHVVTAQALALNEAARAAEVTVVLGCGFSPGITNLLAAYAAQQLDQVEEIEIAVAYSLNDSPGDSIMFHLLRDLGRDAPYVSEFRTAQGRSGHLPRPIYFPEPVGWVETFTCGHPEALTAPRVYGDLRSIRFRTGLTERAAMDALRAAAAAGFSRVRGDLIGARMVRRSVGLLSSLPPRGAAWTSARVDVWGQTAGGSEVISLGVVDHIANLASLPIAYAAAEVGSRSVARPGVGTLEEVLAPGPSLGALARRGMRAARLTPEIFESR